MIQCRKFIISTWECRIHKISEGGIRKKVNSIYSSWVT